MRQSSIGKRFFGTFGFFMSIDFTTTTLCSFMLKSDYRRKESILKSVLHRDGGFNVRVGLVANQFKILVLEVKNVLHMRIEMHLW